MEQWEGHWCISTESIRVMLGDRLPMILDAFRQVKEFLATYMRSPTKQDVETFLDTHKASLIVALQVDALSQTSLQITDGQLQLYSVVDGESQMRVASIIDVEDEYSKVRLTVKDQDGEITTFTWQNDKLLTEDKGLELVFSREATAFFSDPELDVIEQLLSFVRQ